MTPENLALLYNCFLLFLAVLFYSSRSNNSLRNGSTFLLLLVVLSYIGFREIDPFYVDTVTYSMMYKEYEAFPLDSFTKHPDYGFGLFTLVMSYFHSERLYFIVIGLLYVMPVFFVLKKHVPNNYYVGLLLFIGSMSFMPYGVNGLRNGLATTFLVCAFFNKKILMQLLWIVLACSMHKSVALPAFIFLVTRYYNKPKMYVYLWFLCIVLTIVAHGQLESWLGSLSIFNDGNDNRLAGYMSGKFDGGETGNVSFSNTGFRYDFLLYSAIPIYLGWQYIAKFKFTELFYTRLFCTYVATNAAWVLTIYIPFNNRFAYLSWFIYPLVMSYPLLVQNGLIPRQSNRVKLMVLLNSLFTFMMFL